MTVQTKTFNIDGEEYTVTQLGAKQGRRIWLTLVKAAAGPLKEMGQKGGVSELAMVTALATAVENLDEKIVEQLYETFGETCTVRVGDKQPILNGVIFDQHFAGRYLALTKWLWECVRFNFLDFLGDISLGSLSARASSLAAAAETKGAKTVSSGSS